MDIATAHATLYAIVFDAGLALVQEFILPESGEITMGVTEIKRMPKIDVFLCGANKCIFVVEWTGTHFETLSVIPGLHTCKPYNCFYMLTFSSFDKQHRLCRKNALLGLPSRRAHS